MGLTAWLAASVLLLQDPSPQSESPDKTVQFEMEDGSVLVGEILLENLTVKTKYGDLAVPVGDVMAFRPGFGSKPDLRARVKELVDGLGDAAIETRDASEKKLIAMGLRVRDEVRGYRAEGDGELRARLTKVLAAYDEMEQDVSDDDPAARPLQSDDELTSRSFTMRGDIRPKKFKVKTRYGEVTIELGQVRELRRRGGKTGVEKKLTVTAANFTRLEAKDSGIHVERGEKIAIRAEGSLNMTPWEATSSPDGCAQCGASDQGPQVFLGTLMMRIGKSGKWIKVGSHASLSAAQSGTIQFGIAANPQILKGYQFPGEYTVKVKTGE